MSGIPALQAYVCVQGADTLGAILNSPAILQAGRQKTIAVFIPLCLTSFSCQDDAGLQAGPRQIG